MDATSVGTQINVRLQTGFNLEGSFQVATADQLVVATDTGPVRIAKADVFEITTAPKSDSLGNGALIGIGIGLGVAVALLAVAASGDGYVLESAKWAAPLLGIGAGLGAGLAVDAKRKQKTVLYRMR